MAWVGGWLTMRSQWERERTFRQRERLGEALEVATRSLTKAPPRHEHGQWVTDLTAESSRDLHFARVLARGSSPHLARLMEEMSLDETREWRSFVAATDVRVLHGIVSRWFPDPSGFEKAARTLDEYREEFPWDWAAADSDPVVSTGVRVAHRLSRRLRL